MLLLNKKLYINMDWNFGEGLALFFSIDSSLRYGHWVGGEKDKWTNVFAFRILVWYCIVSIQWFPEGVDEWKRKHIS